MKYNNFHEENTVQQKLKLQMLLDTLPLFCKEFFIGIEQTTSIKTQIAYAYDLRLFYQYIMKEKMKQTDVDIRLVSIEWLNKVSMDDVEQFLFYLNGYKKDNKENGQSMFIQNNEKGKARKLASLRTHFNYFYKKGKIKHNPTILIDSPKIHEKNIVRLEIDEVAKLLDCVEFGNNLSDKQMSYHHKTKERDLAILTLLLGTGMRVSECQGLNIDDIDFNINGIKITRKGGNEVILYFGDEVEAALKGYIAKRNTITTLDGHNNALFLSMQRKRISTRSIQNLVKKYANAVISLKNISPHKLRSTYGTNLYRETGDIYLVADVLGHKDVNTTKKHYAEIEDARRRKAAKIIKLRNE